ncbi:MAG: outer membrane beta-barrel protein [Taibaiella sp.]|jgi:opacity protein-like surface antigen
MSIIRLIDYIVENKMSLRHGCGISALVLSVSAWFVPSAYGLEGPYVGVIGGYASIEANPQLHLQLENLPFSQDSHLDFGDNDWMWGPVLGYALMWERFLLAAEFQASWSNIVSTDLDTDGNSTRYTLEEQYALQIRPGLQVYEDLPLFFYGILGVNKAKLSVVAESIPVISYNEWAWGYQIGAGLAYQLTEHLFARFDYVFNDYENISQSGSEFLVGADQNVDITLETSPQSSQYLLGLALIW